MKVFIADDSQMVVERLLNIVSAVPEAQVVGQSPDASEAIRCIRECDPEVVILDLHLRKGSGFHVLEMVKRQKPATAVIVLTNYDNLFYRRKCLEGGANFFMDKSTDFDKVPAVLQSLARHETIKPVKV